MKITIEVKNCFDCPYLKESPQYWYCSEDTLEDLSEDEIIDRRGGPRQFIPNKEGVMPFCPKKRKEK